MNGGPDEFEAIETDDPSIASPSSAASASAIAAAALRAAAAPPAAADASLSAPADLTAMIATARRLQTAREAAAAPLDHLPLSLFADGNTELFVPFFACQCGQQPAHVLQLPVELSCACPVSGRCLLRWLERRGADAASGDGGGSSGHDSARSAGSAESAASSSFDCPCPRCGEDIAADVRAWKTNKYASNQLKHLAPKKLSCPNNVVGCQWRDVFGEDGAGLRDHLAQCAFTQQPCAHCPELVVRADMDEHLATRCTKHMLPCKHKCRLSAEGVVPAAGAGCKREREAEIDAAAATAAADSSGLRPSKQHKGSSSAASAAGRGFASSIDVDADSDVEVAVVVPTPLRLFPASQLAQHESICPNRRLHCGVCHASFFARGKVAHDKSDRHLACMAATEELRRENERNKLAVAAAAAAAVATNEENEMLKRENARLKLAAAAVAAAGASSASGASAFDGAGAAARSTPAAASVSDGGAKRAQPAGIEGGPARNKGGRAIDAEFTDLAVVPTGIVWRGMTFDAYTRGQDKELLWNLRPVHLVSPKRVHAGQYRTDAAMAGLREAGPLTHIVVSGVPHPTGGQRLAAGFVSSDLLLFIIDQIMGQPATASAPESLCQAFGQLKTAVSSFLADRNAGGNAAAAAAPRPATSPSLPELRHHTGASAGPAASFAPPARQPPLLPPINLADPFGGQAHQRPKSPEDVEMADAFPAEVAAAAAASSSPPPAARARADDEGESPEQAGGEFSAEEGEEISNAPAGGDRAVSAVEQGAGSSGRRSSCALAVSFSDFTPVECDIQWAGHRLKIYAYTGAAAKLQGKYLFDSRLVLQALRTLKVSAGSFHNPCDVVGWYCKRRFISRCSYVSVTGMPPSSGAKKGRATFMTHFALTMVLGLYHRPIGSCADELVRVRPLVDSISRFENDSGEDSGEDSDAQESDEAAETNNEGDGEGRKANSAAPKRSTRRIRLAEMQSLATLSWSGIAIGVYHYDGQVWYDFRDLFTELQSLDVIPSAGWASQRTSLARFHERRMKSKRGACHQLVVTDAPHATGTSTVTFVSHALLRRILSLQHLYSATPAQLEEVRPLLDLIEPFALQPQGEEAKEGEPDGESGGGSGDDEEGCSDADGDSDSETDSMPDESGSDDEYGDSSRAVAVGRPSAFGQRAPDVAFSDLVRVPTGIAWRGVAVDAYQYKGQGQLLWSMRLISRVLGPKGMRLSGCRTPADIVHAAKISMGGQRLIAAGGNGAGRCIIFVSGVPSPPDTRRAHLAANLVSSPMLLIIFDWVVKHGGNKARDVQRVLKQMREDVERASSPRGSGASAAAAHPAPIPHTAASSPVQATAGGGASSQPGRVTGLSRP